MKLNRIKLFFLLVLIAVCSVAESASRSKERRSKTLNKSKAQNGPNGILDQFKNYKGKDSLLVFLGILSKFFDEEKFDALVKSKLDALLDSKILECFKDTVAIQEQQLNQAKPYFEKAERVMGLMNDKTKRENYCELMKYQARAVWIFQKEKKTDLATLDKIFSDNHTAIEQIKNSGSLNWLNYTAFTFKDTICSEFKLKATEEKIKEKFGTIANYTKQCMFWLKASCSDYNPDSADLTQFAQKAWTSAKGIMDKMNCAITKVQYNSSFKDFLKPNLLNVASGIANGVIHYLSFGSWGAIKAGYYLIRLGIQIHEFYNKGEQTPYRVGKILGTCAQIVKSLLVGRRRRRLMKY